MKKRKREKRIKEKLGCEFIRINFDEKDYDEYHEFDDIINHIDKSKNKLTKMSFMDKI